MKKFYLAALAALVLSGGGAFAQDYIELFDDDEIEWDYLSDHGNVDATSSNPLKATLTLENEDEKNDVWPWLYIGTSPYVVTFETLTKVDVTYTSDGLFKIGIAVEVEPFEEDGETIDEVTYEAILSKSAAGTTKLLNLSDFEKPEWPTSYSGPASLSQVDASSIIPGISFFHEIYGSTVEIEVSSIKLYGVEWLEEESGENPISKTAAAKASNFSITGITAGKLGLNVPASGNYSIAIYGVNGKMLAQTKANLVKGVNTLSINKNLARGAAVVRIQGANAALVKKILVK